jgi:Na+/H+ antiporter NhaD/arsenite permease-like protein
VKIIWIHHGDYHVRVNIKTLIIAAFSLIAAALITLSISVPSTGIGGEIQSAWRSESNLQVDLNSNSVLYRQVISLALFIFVIGLVVVSPKYRYYAAFFSIAILAITATSPHSELIKSVDWRLILFLAGSMTLAYILRSLRVFEFILVKLIRVTKGSFTAVFAILMIMAWFLAMILDEATSIVYITMFIFELARLGIRDIKPLIVLGVLATNTGSLALPVGNPIGVYLAFTAKLTIRDFLVKALPLSALLLFLLIVISILLFKSYFEKCNMEIRSEAINIYSAHMMSEFALSARKLQLGVLYMFAFLILVASVDWIAQYLSLLVSEETDPHTLLAFIPYLIIALTPLAYNPEELEKAILTGVEWPSLLFFIALFMLGDSLKYTGVTYKLAYAVTQITGVAVGRIAVTLLVFSAILSAFLDNLSVIVALTPVARAYYTMTQSSVFYWVLLYGGVIGGNFTPIGSTANIVAWGLAERSKAKLSWGFWLKIALVLTLLQLIVTLTYAAFALRAG